MHKIKQLLLVSILFFSCSLSANENISISDVWISEAPPNISVLAAYAKIQNTSDELQTLILIRCPLFSKIELHLSKVIDGVAKMEKQNSLTIPAQDTIELSPGAFHLMLFDPKAPLKSGDTTTITFTFADGTSNTVEANVKKRNVSDHEHDHHDH